MGGAPVIETVRAGVQFTPAAAASFRRLEARLGRRVDVNSTYRDYAKQMSMYNAWNAYASGRGPYPGHSRAIHPDMSVHCRGMALDSDDWTTPGFNTVAAEYGWIRTAANDPTERHHFEYQSWNDKHRFEPAPAGITSTEEDMPLTDQDVIKILDARFQVTDAKGATRAVAVKEALGYAVLGHDATRAVPGQVWTHPLQHPLANRAVSAGDLLRYEPAEHANTRVAVSLVATGDFDYDKVAAEIAEKFPSLDVQALAVAAADETDRRQRERLKS
jgi:hypothetical protein